VHECKQLGQNREQIRRKFTVNLFMIEDEFIFIRLEF